MEQQQTNTRATRLRRRPSPSHLRHQRQAGSQVVEADAGGVKAVDDDAPAARLHNAVQRLQYGGTLL